VTEQARRGEVVQEQVEVPEWVELAKGEWVAQEPVQVRGENVCVQNAERQLLMKSEHPATLRNAPNAVHRWLENRYGQTPSTEGCVVGESFEP